MEAEPNQDDLKAVLFELLNDVGNSVCADCGT